MESRKMVLRIYLEGSNGETDRIHLRTWERGGEGEMYWKSNMETYITMCRIDSQREFVVWLKKLKQGLCTNLEG